MSFYVTKTVLVGPNRFGLDHNDLLSTKMKWSRPKWIGQVQIVIFYQNESQFGPEQFIFVGLFHFGCEKNHYGQVQINFARPKLFWTNQNCFGHIEGHGINIYIVIAENVNAIKKFFWQKMTRRKFLEKNQDISPTRKTIHICKA